MLAGIGFCDALLRRLDLRDGDLPQELLQWTASFPSNYRAALDNFVGAIPDEPSNGEVRLKPCDFAAFVSYGEHLLVQPGIEEVLTTMCFPAVRADDGKAKCESTGTRFWIVNS